MRNASLSARLQSGREERHRERRINLVGALAMLFCLLAFWLAILIGIAALLM